MASLLTDIEAFLAANPTISATGFGDRALADRHFVRQLRKGRRVWPETEKKIRNFMRAFEAVADAPVDNSTGETTATAENEAGVPVVPERDAMLGAAA